MTKTTNYNLNQWEAEDVITREDFNADNATIDAALKTVADAAGSGAKISYGTYAGTGKYGYANRITLTFDFEPKLVLIARADAMFTYFDGAVKSFALFLRPQTQFHYQIDTGRAFCKNAIWSENAISWYGESPNDHLNSDELTYAYLAIG